MLAIGFAGPLLLLSSFAVRYGLGLDAAWYLAALVGVGYVTAAPVLVAIAWLAAAAQLVALVAGRYAPYPRAEERPPRGPLRVLMERIAAAIRTRRTAPAPATDALEA